MAPEDLIPVAAIVAGVLMLLARQRYAQFMLGLVAGENISESTRKRIGQFCSIGMGCFGIVVVAIGVGMGVSRLLTA